MMFGCFLILSWHACRLQPDLFPSPLELRGRCCFGEVGFPIGCLMWPSDDLGFGAWACERRDVTTLAHLLLILLRLHAQKLAYNSSGLPVLVCTPVIATGLAQVKLAIPKLVVDALLEARLCHPSQQHIYE
jgi:hypothetical protein